MDQIDLIARYIEDNLEFFCGPDGLKWPRPGGLPKYYLDHPLEWRLDKKRVQSLREASGVEETPPPQGAAPPSPMSADTRKLLNEIRELWQRGHRDADIAARLNLPERCVRNAVRLGERAESPEAQAPDHGPDVGRFLDGYAKWPAGGAR